MLKNTEMILLHKGFISELRDMYKEQLCFPPPRSLCFVHCVLCLPHSIMHPRHVYNRSVDVVCLYATKAHWITARRQETPVRWVLSDGFILVALSLTRSNLSRHLLYPPIPFARMEGPLLRMKDMSRRFWNIHLSTRTRGASLLCPLKKRRGGKKKWISKYSGMSSVNIRHYGPALFMKLPLSSLALLSISHMKRPPALNNIHRKVHSHSHIHKKLQTAACYHYNTGMFDEQYRQHAMEKREQTCRRLAYSWRLFLPPFQLTFINRDHTGRQEHSVSLILFYPLFFLGLQRKRTSKINVVSLIAISIRAEGTAVCSYRSSPSLSQH